MPSRRPPALLLVLLLGLLGALLPTGAAAAAERDQVLSGRVVDSGGRAVPGAAVVVDEGLGVLASVLTAVVCVFSFGFDAESCGAHQAVARTDAAGRFRVRLPAGSPVARPGVRQVTVTAPGAGRVPVTTGSFALRRSTRALPLVTLWTSPATLARADGRVRLTRRLPAGATSAVLRLRGVEPPSYDVAWPLAFDRAGRADLDARVFEQGVRGLDGSAAGRWSGRPARWESASSGVPQAGRPGSRGLPCFTYRAGDELVALPGCPFTDGRLATSLGLFKALDLERRTAMCRRTSDCSSPYTVVLDLGEVRRPDAVVWRGCPSCHLELSLDGRLWLPWREERREGTSFAVVTGALQPARYVRVRGVFTMLWRLQELSVWSSELLPAATASVAGRVAQPGGWQPRVGEVGGVPSLPAVPVVPLPLTPR